VLGVEGTGVLVEAAGIPERKMEVGVEVGGACWGVIGVPGVLKTSLRIMLLLLLIGFGVEGCEGIMKAPPPTLPGVLAEFMVVMCKREEGLFELIANGTGELGRVGCVVIDVTVGVVVDGKDEFMSVESIILPMSSSPISSNTLSKSKSSSKLIL